MMMPTRKKMVKMMNQLPMTIKIRTRMMMPILSLKLRMLLLKSLKQMSLTMKIHPAVAKKTTQHIQTKHHQPNLAT